MQRRRRTTAVVLLVAALAVGFAIGAAHAASSQSTLAASCEASLPGDAAAAVEGATARCSADVPNTAAPAADSTAGQLEELADTRVQPSDRSPTDHSDDGDDAMVQQVAPPSNHTPRYTNAAEAAAADAFPPPTISGLRVPSEDELVGVDRDREAEKAYLQALYDAPVVKKGRSLRTPRPQYKPQRPPKAIVFNTSNVHELTPTPINLRYIPNFMTIDECQHFIKLSNELGTKSSPVLLENGQYDFNNSKRTSTTTFLQQSYDAVVETLEWRIARLTNVDKSRVSMFQIVRYEPYQRFYGHYDGNEAIPLRYTIFAYLNDIQPGQGGETDFPELGLRFQPQRGNAVFWENR